MAEHLQFTFMQAQETKNFRPLEKLRSFKNVLKPDDNKDYKEMGDRKLYKRYPRFFDKLKFDSKEQKLFVIFMMNYKKYYLHRQYVEILTKWERDRMVPGDWE